MRRKLLVAVLLVLGACHASPRGDARTAAPPTAVELRAPFDHAAPSDGTFPVRYELGAPFDPAKPTVMLVADGQQFWVRPGAVAALQAELVGSAFNVVAVVPRSQSPEVLARASAAVVDWGLAYRLFASAQYIADLELVRRHVVGAEGRVLLYGRSGGAFLIHEYLARHCEHVDRAFTQATLNPFVQAELGIVSDRFWDEVSPQVREQLQGVLARLPAQRLAIARLFQRQNFFEPEIAAARAELAARLYAGDTAYVAERRRAYQVDAIDALLASPAGIPARVRLFELYQPIAALRPGPEVLSPDLENAAAIAAPLQRALTGGAVEPPRMELASLGRCNTEVLLLAGQRDHTADVRLQAPLAARYRHARVVMLDDDHVFARLRGTGVYHDLVAGFLADGFGGASLADALAKLAPLAVHGAG